MWQYATRNKKEIRRLFAKQNTTTCLKFISSIRSLPTKITPMRRNKLFRTRVRPFRKKIFSLISEIKRIWIRFTCVSLFHYKISLLFFPFFSLFFAFFAFFRFFSLFFVFFALFRVKFSLRFDLVIFASKQNKSKRNSSLFFAFFAFFYFFRFFRFFPFFSLNFCFTSIFFA
jgi:hypothetical protein